MTKNTYIPTFHIAHGGNLIDPAEKIVYMLRQFTNRLAHHSDDGTDEFSIIMLDGDHGQSPDSMANIVKDWIDKALSNMFPNDQVVTTVSPVPFDDETGRYGISIDIVLTVDDNKPVNILGVMEIDNGKIKLKLN